MLKKNKKSTARIITMVHTTNGQTWLVGWEIKIPFQHRNKLYWGQGFGLRMTNNTVTSQPRCLFVQRRPKMGKDGKAHLSYYASAYNRVETNLSCVTAVLQFL